MAVEPGETTDPGSEFPEELPTPPPVCSMSGARRGLTALGVQRGLNFLSVHCDLVSSGGGQSPLHPVPSSSCTILSLFSPCPLRKLHQESCSLPPCSTGFPSPPALPPCTVLHGHRLPFCPTRATATLCPPGPTRSHPVTPSKLRRRLVAPDALGPLAPLLWQLSLLLRVLLGLDKSWALRRRGPSDTLRTRSSERPEMLQVSVGAGHSPQA